MYALRLFITFLLTINAAYPIVVVTVYQSGNNVVLEGSGSINTDALNPVYHELRSLEDISSFTYPRVAFNAYRMMVQERWAGSLSGPNIKDLYTSGLYLKQTPDLFTGDFFGIINSPISNANEILIPHNYISGSALSATYTFNGKSLQDFGLTGAEESLIWSWGADTSYDTFTLSVIPESSTYALLIGCLALSAAFFRRRFKS